jgi:hypothetical protein
VINKFNPEEVETIEIQMIEDANNFNLSDESLDAVGDIISSLIDINKN